MPTGDILPNSQDMAKYLLFQMNIGGVVEVQVISKVRVTFPSSKTRVLNMACMSSLLVVSNNG
jgi:hypothetical protein